MSDDRFEQVLSATTALQQTVLRSHSDVMDRIDRLQNVVTGIRDDRAVNLHNTDLVERDISDLRTEMVRLESRMWHLRERVERLEGGAAPGEDA